jgi:RHS repeat-associated protein
MVGVFLDSGSTPQESFVYHAAGNAGRGSSSYIDSVVMRDRDTNTDGTLEERRYYVQNWRADVVAITKSNGDPLQYVVYSPYGEPVTHAVADVDLDGDVDSNDQTAWANGAPNSTFAYAAQEDLNHDGADTAADDALFDESYGDNLGLSGRGRLTAAKLDNRKGYAGYEHDESLTMYHVRHRVYRADLGRWMTRDPLGYVDGMGLYEYVGGMAVRGRDPSGLARAVCPIGRGCAGQGPITNPRPVPPVTNPIDEPTVPSPSDPPCLNYPAGTPFDTGRCAPGTFPPHICYDPDIKDLLDKLESRCGCKPKIKCDKGSSCGCGRFSANLVGGCGTVSICVPHPATCGSTRSTLHHELIHAWQNCRGDSDGGLDFCTGRNQTEYEAYFAADCRVGSLCARIQCACEGAQRSMPPNCKWFGRGDPYWYDKCMARLGVCGGGGAQ